MLPMASVARTEEQRHHMVSEHLVQRGIRDARVLHAMGSVAREMFVPEHLRQFAYADAPLAIGAGQTISQPFMVGLMVQALRLSGRERVLEIGTGSGYAAAVLAELVAEVYTVERIAMLAERAAATLKLLGYQTIRFHIADGSLGWPEHAPYDAIIVAAGGPKVPEALKEQLAVGGRLVVPIGSDEAHQELVRITRVATDDYVEELIAAVRFVPLLGEQAWNGVPRPSGRPAGPKPPRGGSS